MGGCIFCKIVKGELPSYKVLEDDKHLSFLTIRPFKEGHTLVIPKEHTDYIFELDDQELGDLMVFAKKVSNLLMKAFNPPSGKIGILVAGEEVSHVHVHLVPFSSGLDLSFANEKQATPEELQDALRRLQTH